MPVNPTSSAFDHLTSTQKASPGIQSTSTSLSVLSATAPFILFPMPASSIPSFQTSPFPKTSPFSASPSITITAVCSPSSTPWSPSPYDALAAYDLRSRERLFLAPLHGDADLDSSLSRQIANDVTVDFAGNAYVTNAAANFIWKVNAKGEASIFSRSPVFTEYPVDRSSPYSFCGLNGILYISKGYLLAVQSNTGKMFKVDAEDGTARLVLLPRDLPWADGIAVRKDGIVVVVSQSKAWFLKSEDSWAEGAIFDETALEPEWFPTSVTMGGDQRVYVIYGHMEEGIFRKGEREAFSIEEIRSERESGEEKIWVYVLVGLGLSYFLFWRFQMKQLIKNLDKKTN